jgi:hypothetical protein
MYDKSHFRLKEEMAFFVNKSETQMKMIFILIDNHYQLIINLLMWKI